MPALNRSIRILRRLMKNMQATGREKTGIHEEGCEGVHKGSDSQWQYSLWSWHNWQAPRQVACWEEHSRWRDSSGQWRLCSALLQYLGSHWGSSCSLQFIKSRRQSKTFAILNTTNISVEECWIFLRVSQAGTNLILQWLHAASG